VPEASNRWGLWIVLALVLLIRVPFWNQAIQGDDTIYLHEAAHALIEPLHPDNTRYVFQGGIVDLRGHPHGPMDAWVLAALLAIFGDVKEIPFHATYTLFSLIAAASMWRLARRYSPQPLWATLMFVAVPVFVVNGNSLETDIPFLAFWLAGVALFESYWPLSCLFLAAAAMTASLPSALLLTPVLGVWVWLFRRHDKTRWAAIFVPPVTLVAWQVFERITGGTLPAQVLGGYLTRFPIFNPSARIALLLHFCFLVSPIILPEMFALVWRKRREAETRFHVAWIAIFMAGVLAVFFAGSARYLLPIAAPLAILASRLPVKWIAPAFAIQLGIGLGLAAANYEHWDGNRRFAASIKDVTANHRVFVDNDWGLRYYIEADHGRPALRGQHVRPGDIVVSSELGHNVEFTAPMAVIARAVIQPSVPFRLIGLESDSGYSTVSMGWWPFGISTGVVDRVEARIVKERNPTLEYVTPKDTDQIVSGVYPNDRWMSGTAAVVLKQPAMPKKLRAEIYVPPNAAARRITLLLDGREVAWATIPGTGPLTVESRALVTGTTVEVRVDKTFRAPGDQRDLGVVLLGVGFPH